MNNKVLTAKAKTGKSSLKPKGFGAFRAFRDQLQNNTQGLLGPGAFKEDVLVAKRVIALEEAFASEESLEKSMGSCGGFFSSGMEECIEEKRLEEKEKKSLEDSPCLRSCQLDDIF